jgi:DNA-binding CsgD family transcriptional regulator
MLECSRVSNAALCAKKLPQPAIFTREGKRWWRCAETASTRSPSLRARLKMAFKAQQYGPAARLIVSGSVLSGGHKIDVRTRYISAQRWVVSKWLHPNGALAIKKMTTNGMSQRQIGDVLGVHQATVSEDLHFDGFPSKTNGEDPDSDGNPSAWKAKHEAELLEESRRGAFFRVDLNAGNPAKTNGEEG